MAFVNRKRRKTPSKDNSLERCVLHSALVKPCVQVDLCKHTPDSHTNEHLGVEEGWQVPFRLSYLMFLVPGFNILAHWMSWSSPTTEAGRSPRRNLRLD